MNQLHAGNIIAGKFPPPASLVIITISAGHDGLVPDSNINGVGAILIAIIPRQAVASVTHGCATEGATPTSFYGAIMPRAQIMADFMIMNIVIG